MQLGIQTLNKTSEEFLKELASFAEDSETLIFLDTNILAFLFRIHTAARKDFFDWTDMRHRLGY